MRFAFLTSPRRIFHFAGRLLPGLAVAGFSLCAVGFGLGLSAPAAELTGGDLSRIALVYVPSTWLSLILFLTIAFWAMVGLVQDQRFPHMMAQALAPTGGMFTFLALWSGALWAKGGGGYWWVGDACQIAEVVLLFAYLGIVGAPVLFIDGRRADRLAAVIALFGLSVVPIVVSCFPWWNSPQALGGASGGGTLLVGGVVCVTVGLWLYASMSALVRLRHIILEREYVHGARSEA